MAGRGKRYTEEQIIGILKEAAAGGAAVGEVIRRHGVSPQTYYAWKAKFAGMEVSEARRLKQLEEENRRVEGVGGSRAWTSRGVRRSWGKSGGGRRPRRGGRAAAG